MSFLSDFFAAALEWIQSSGVWGPVLLVSLYVLMSMLMVPVWPLTIGAGFLFGFIRGAPTALVGLMAGAAAAFAVSRYVARGTLLRWFGHRPTFRALDRAVVRDGFAIITLTRLSPAVPFNVLNYLFGMTGVTGSRFLWASVVGMIPGVAMHVYLGTAAHTLLDVVHGHADAGAASLWILAFGVVATILGTIVIGQATRRALREVTEGTEERR
jgi:uncharacterized membrane protein YdjX (TVP38/TMEM64 family)